MATALQLPEGYTVRKVGNSLKVVPMRKRNVAIAKEKEMDDSFEEQVRRHDERMKEVYAQRAAEKAALEAKYTAAIENPPTLKGSEKQVSWASKIRGAYIEFYQDRRREWCAQEVIEHTDAKYWIDNRYGMGVTNSDQRAIQALIYSK